MATEINLLFLFTDEQAASTLAAYGNELIETPNLDRLASRSVVFEKAYVTQPVCTPSRASIMTGLWPHATGCTENNVPLPAEARCLPELACLRRDGRRGRQADFSGYRTAYFGKWHLGDEIFAQHGFEEWRSIEDAYRGFYSEGRDRTRTSTYAEFLIGNGVEPDVTADDGVRFFSRPCAARLDEGLSKPAYLAREARRFIRENRDRPFLLYVNFLEPHMPFFGPRDSQYDPARVRLPANFRHELSTDQPLKARLYARGYRERGHSGLELRTEADWRRMIANYWGLVSLVDTHAGTILDELEDSRLADRTIVVFTSDHGDMMGSHGLLAKCVMFEEAVRAPLLLRIPGIEGAGRRVGAPVSQIDLVPTLLDAMGREVPHDLPGASWMPFLRGEGPLAEEDVFCEWTGPNSGFVDRVGWVRPLDCWREVATDEEIERAITDPVRAVVTPDGWKYNWTGAGENELYNLRDDPGETRNLVRRGGRAREPGLVGELRGRIRRWQERTGDTVTLSAE
jgi:arylsulfatase A-like enzyme